MTCSPSLTTVQTVPNPNWPPFRDSLDDDVRKAMDSGDIKAWTRAMRRRLVFGGHLSNGAYVDYPNPITVSKPFMALLREELKRRGEDGLNNEATETDDGIVFRRIPVVVG